MSIDVGRSIIESRGATEHPTPVEAARVAIWRLYEEGYVDEDMATAGLLAVDLGTRRAQQRHDVDADLRARLGHHPRVS
jgi:hypothetical protein